MRKTHRSMWFLSFLLFCCKELVFFFLTLRELATIANAFFFRFSSFVVECSFSPSFLCLFDPNFSRPSRPSAIMARRSSYEFFAFFCTPMMVPSERKLSLSPVLAFRAAESAASLRRAAPPPPFLASS